MPLAFEDSQVESPSSRRHRRPRTCRRRGARAPSPSPRTTRRRRPPAASRRRGSSTGQPRRARATTPPPIRRRTSRRSRRCSTERRERDSRSASEAETPRGRERRSATSDARRDAAQPPIRTRQVPALGRIAIKRVARDHRREDVDGRRRRASRSTRRPARSARSTDRDRVAELVIETLCRFIAVVRGRAAARRPRRRGDRAGRASRARAARSPSSRCRSTSPASSRAIEACACTVRSPAIGSQPDRSAAAGLARREGRRPRRRAGLDRGPGDVRDRDRDGEGRRRPRPPRRSLPPRGPPSRA